MNPYRRARTARPIDTASVADRSSPTADPQTAGDPQTVEGLRRGRHLSLGRGGEDLAVDYLTARGLIVLERNYRCPRGEIDIIAQDGETIVFVEVKTRRTAAQGSPLEAITARKHAKLREVALHWLAAQEAYHSSLRFAGIGIVTSPEPSCEYVPDLGDLR